MIYDQQKSFIGYFFIYLIFGFLIWHFIKWRQTQMFWETRTVLRLIPLDITLNIRNYKMFLLSFNN